MEMFKSGASCHPAGKRGRIGRARRRARPNCSGQLLLPAELSDQRNELRRAAVFDLYARPDAHHAREPLVAFGTDGDDQLAGPRELFEQQLRQMCERLLANTVIENFSYTIEE